MVARLSAVSFLGAAAGMGEHFFLDFDGTLVDSRRRQYDLFCELVSSNVLPFDEYWQLKRRGVDQAGMLERFFGFSEERRSSFKTEWMNTIEDAARLEADTLFPGVRDFLAAAAGRFQVYLVTGRQQHGRLLDQMKRLMITEYFSGILNTAQQVSKVDLVRRAVKVCPGDVFVGDTGEDVLAGKELGIYTVGVTSGVTSAERMRRYGPNLIVGSVSELDPVTLFANGG